MDEVGAGQDDHGARAQLESEDWAINQAKVFDVFEEMLAGAGDLEEVSNDRPSAGSRREVEPFLGDTFLDEKEDEYREC